MKHTSSFWLRLGIFIGVLGLFAVLSWAWWVDGISSVDAGNETPVTFVIPKGEGVRAIAGRLAQQNLIRSATAFYLIVKIMGIETQIQAGDYRLSKAMDAQTIAGELTHGIVDTWVTTLEGWRIEEVANTLAKELDIPEKEFLQYAREGYMFPDTYLIPQEATPAGIAQLFEKNFDAKVTGQMKEDAQQTGRTLEEVVILASIVEREGRSDTDRPMIAGILLNRIKENIPLQVDATLQYALGYQPYEKTWWKKILTNEDKRIKSPYNTYLHTGFPPGPIANPGLSSIKAVIYPEPSDNLFYLHDPKGLVHVARTLEEHNANIGKYLGN